MEKYLYSDLYELEEKHWWHKAKRDAVIQLIKDISKKRLEILDIGCGSGKNVESLGKFGKVWGIDLEEEAIKFCKKRELKRIKKASSEKAGFAANSFDVVTLLDVLEHTDEKKTLLEIRRILKRNGFLLITVPAYRWLWSKWDEVLHHKRRYDKKNLKRLLKNHGFNIMMISYMYPHLVLPAFFIRFIRSKLSNHKGYKSDFRINNAVLNSILYLVAKLQLKILKITNIPFGTSLICLAKVQK